MWISLQQPGSVADDTYVYHCLIIVISIIIGGGIRRVSGKVLQSCMSEYSKKHYIVFKNLVCVVSPKHTMCCRMIRRLRAFLSGVSPVSAWYVQSQRGGMPLCTSTDKRVRWQWQHGDGLHWLHQRSLQPRSLSLLPSSGASQGTRGYCNWGMYCWMLVISFSANKSVMTCN